MTVGVTRSRRAHRRFLPQDDDRLEPIMLGEICRQLSGDPACAIDRPASLCADHFAAVNVPPIAFLQWVSASAGVEGLSPVV